MSGWLAFHLIFKRYVFSGTTVSHRAFLPLQRRDT